MNNSSNALKTLFTSAGGFISRAWDFLTKPHPSVTEVGERKQAQLLAVLSLILIVPFTLAILSSPQTVGTFIIFLAITLLAYIASRTRFYRVGAYFFSFGFTSIAYLNVYNGSANSIYSSVASTVPIAFILASAILSQRGFILLVIATIAATASIGSYADPKYFADPTYSFGRTIGVPFSAGFILYGITAFRASLERARLKEMQEINSELQAVTSDLEQRVAERTKALATSAEVSRRLASILDPQQLANAVVNQVQTAFDYYYAQIYLFDQAGENLVLTAGTGEAGAEMMKRGHSLPKGRGLVGRAAETKESILVSDTSQDSGWLPNELLPDTKAEAVVPIVIGDKVFGALDVQDNVTNEIFSEDITLLESLASQVAISLQNAKLFAEAQKFQDQYSLAVDGSNDGIWDWDLKTNEVYFSPRWKAIVGYGEDELNNGFADFEALLHPDDKDRALTTVNNYLAGKLKTYDIEFRFHHKDGSYRWVRARGKAMRDASGAPYRMAGSHTDITDSKETEQNAAQRARQQETINVITQKIQAATTIEDAMQVAARELGRALGKRQTLVALEPSALSGHDGKTVAE